ncbi:MULTISPECIES: ribonuclease E/G [unclassified Ruegeria]|uniref:ribonuclease E/G n=1 Tax=unclassified Ruegeria TaxID=2625375 RepID=UPI001489737A|nr:MULTISPECIES: ribonuclease E/G [unclassified Ruegeria]NOD35425.1 ribonuclease G [Ruegeria sp. HKCCD7296]NOE42810.1 ribonuclease G [Ruegeria sp. HKCCD7319]
MKGRTIVLDHIEDREAAALMVDGKLDDFLISADAPTPGTIYRARADRPVKGQGGMFLTTPDGPAFLRQVKGLAPGALLLVQVSGYAEQGKAIPVSNRILFKSRYAIVTPEAPGLNISRSIRDDDTRDQLLEIAHEQMGDSPYGLILRSCCAGADADDIAEDISAMLAQADQVMNDDGTETEVLSEGDGPHILAWRDWTDPAEVVTQAGGFESHGVLDALDMARGTSELLPGGGHLYVEPTRALVAVDVNTGSDTSLAAGTKANFACAKLLPRALRVRGLAGQITLDLAPMPKKDRRGFESALRAAFKSDPDETILAGWTPLGHFELQRKRSRLPLAEILK